MAEMSWIARPAARLGTSIPGLLMSPSLVTFGSPASSIGKRWYTVKPLPTEVSDVLMNWVVRSSTLKTRMLAAP